MIKKKKHISGWTIACIVFCAISFVAAIYCMVNGLGLQEDLDFGAGAYYYADIPDFDKYLAWDAFKTNIPYLVYLAIFLIWGVIVYKIWKWVDNKSEKKD